MTRKKQIAIPIIILAVGVGAYLGFSSMKKPPAEKLKRDTTPIVSIHEISLSSMLLNVQSHGVVKPKYETELVAQVSGELVELSEHFVRGAFIKKGDVLAKIDPSDYQAALIDAEATLASAKASLHQEVAQGKVAEKEWNRITESSPTELSLRKPQLAKELANVKAAEAKVLLAKRNLERTEIKAPYDALIENRLLGLGAYISKGNPLGKVLSTESAEVRLPVAENQLPFLNEQGLHANVILKGSFAGEETDWQAQIVRLEGVVDSKSRMNYLVAEIQDPYALTSANKAIRFGSYVNAEISGKNIDNAASIPRYLLSDHGVPLLDSDNKLRFVKVDIIRHDGKNVIVSNGLVAGDKLITSALDYPLNGMQLALATTPETELEADNENVVTTELASVKE